MAETELLEMLRGHDWDGVVSRLDTHAGQMEAKTRDSVEGKFPLCDLVFLVFGEAPAHVMIAIIQAYPDALTEPYTTIYQMNDWDTASPCSGLRRLLTFLDLPLEIMEAVILAKPECIKIPDPSDGQIALHLVASRTASKAMVNLLINSYPEGLEARDKSGQLPLHKACQRRKSALKSTSAAIIRTLLLGGKPSSQSQTETKIATGIQELDHAEQTPLNLACQRGHFSRKTFHLLLEAYPEAIEIPNHRGQLPLHHACLNLGVSHDFVLTLISKHPQGLLHRDHNGKSPVSIAIASYAYYFRAHEEASAVDRSTLVGMLVYSTYRIFALDEDALLDIQDAAPRNASERINCFAYGAHMVHPIDFEFMLGQCLRRHEEDHQGETDATPSGEMLAIGEDAHKNNHALHLLWNEKSFEFANIHNPPTRYIYHHRSDEEETILHSDSDQNTRDDTIQDGRIQTSSKNTTHGQIFFKFLTREEQRTAASHRNDQGQLALHHVLKYGTSTGHDMLKDAMILADAYPESCSIPNPLSHLFPFMEAAMGNQACMSTTFSLLGRFVAERPLHCFISR
jgi:hypothetical protein